MTISPDPTPQAHRAPPSPLASPPFNNLGFFSTPPDLNEWPGSTLLDTIETYWDSHIDLLERRLKKHSDRLKIRAERALARTKSRTGEDIERELQRFKHRATNTVASFSQAWRSASVMRTREKVSFFFGVMTVLVSALLFGMAPQWIHLVYTILALILLPIRFVTYRRQNYHYFLADQCYFVNILCLIYLWILPGNKSLFVACYCLCHGTLASAVITWRNSLVFHSVDKVTSLFIHIYPPFAFTVIRHFYPNAGDRFPALIEVPHLQPLVALGLSGILYLFWQGLYIKFILVDRREKIEAGQRTTSYSWLLNDKHSAIGRALSSLKPETRPFAFQLGQLVYSIVTELPAVFLLYDSPLWSGIFLFFIFSVSVWNGGGFYIEVFGRKFERELEALRKELAEASARSGAATPANGSESGHATPTGSEDEMSNHEEDSPVVVPREVTNSLMLDTQPGHEEKKDR
ncbi:hypothetical protein BOTBODRAFT_60699 [Botryobasidium botryosum FD-172 SS1]|uniref:Glycerophosphocholine acyltransferase 1 n=1 Tax=Botryobasidium botryosum (strain FD-172 SS1) TaxID=930990 RepID=A0A067LSL5_BOTB1|nr:hypothetical protein BOTBODRAFT_60699 [Botryobasidium botryosum FD-172 SS1]